MNLRSFISRLQQLNAYLEDYLPYTEEQETAPLPADEIMDIIYYSMTTTWKNKMIEQSFNYADFTAKEMTDFFETRLEHLKSKEDKKKSSSVDNKGKENNSNKKRKQADTDSSVVDFSEESSMEYKPIKKYCILYGKCSYSTDLRDTVNKHKQKKRKSIMSYETSYKEKCANCKEFSKP